MILTFKVTKLLRASHHILRVVEYHRVYNWAYMHCFTVKLSTHACSMKNNSSLKKMDMPILTCIFLIDLDL